MNLDIVYKIFCVFVVSFIIVFAGYRWKQIPLLLKKVKIAFRDECKKAKTSFKEGYKNIKSNIKKSEFWNVQLYRGSVHLLKILGFLMEVIITAMGVVLFKEILGEFYDTYEIGNILGITKTVFVSGLVINIFHFVVIFYVIFIIVKLVRYSFYDFGETGYGYTYIWGLIKSSFMLCVLNYYGTSESVSSIEKLCYKVLFILVIYIFLKFFEKRFLRKITDGIKLNIDNDRVNVIIKDVYRDLLIPEQIVTTYSGDCNLKRPIKSTAVIRIIYSIMEIAVTSEWCMEVAERKSVSCCD